MLLRSWAGALVMLAACISHAEALLYSIESAPKEWRLSISELPIQQRAKPAGPPLTGSKANKTGEDALGRMQWGGFAPPPTSASTNGGEPSKFDRDFSGPVGSPGFGAPFTVSGSAGMARGGPPAVSTPLPKSPPADTKILLDSGPDYLYIHCPGSEVKGDYLFHRGTVFTTSSGDDIPLGEVRLSALPSPSQAILSIVLGRTVPTGMHFRAEEESQGVRTEVWKQAGMARIILRRRTSDGALVEARLMAPGSTNVSEIWKIKEWKEGQPVKAVSFLVPMHLYLAESLASQPAFLTGSLYTLVSASPSKKPTVKDVFRPGLMILDSRASLDSGRAEFSYPWRGRLMDAAEMKRLDRELDSPLPDFLKGSNATQGGIILLGGVCGLLLLSAWLTRRLGGK